MRIAFLAPYVRGADAVGLQLVEYARLLVDRNHDVRLFVERMGSGVPADVLALTRVLDGPPALDSDEWTYLQTANLVIADYPAYYGLIECLRLLSGPAVVFSYHGVTPPELWPDPAGRAFLERSRRRAGLAHFADVAIVRSQFTRQELHTLTGYPLERIKLVPYVISPRPIGRWTETSPTAPPFILSVGRVAAHKRPALLVDALAIVRREISGARLVLAGDARGPSHAPVLEQVREHAASLGLSEAIYCTGEVNGALLEHLYESADLLVSVSAHEGFCIPVVEAMARGVPVVATATGALPETIGDAGVLVPDGDLEGLAAGMLRLLQHQEQREELIARGYARAARYRPEIVGAELGRLIEGLAPRRVRRPGLPRLGQRVDLPALDAAAEVGALPLPAGRKIPLISVAAARLRRWLTSDLERRQARLVEEQVAFNRHVAQAVRAIDELSAAISETQASRPYDD